MGKVIAVDLSRHSKSHQNFSDVLGFLKDGGIIKRFSWNEKTKCLMNIEIGDTFYPNFIKDRNFIGVRQSDGSFLPWAPTQDDILADDWEIVEGSIP